MARTRTVGVQLTESKEHYRDNVPVANFIDYLMGMVPNEIQLSDLEDAVLVDLFQSYRREVEAGQHKNTCHKPSQLSTSAFGLAFTAATWIKTLTK